MDEMSEEETDKMLKELYIEHVVKQWKKACEYDNIDPKSKFVIFSKDNPYRN